MGSFPKQQRPGFELNSLHTLVTCYGEKHSTPSGVEFVCLFVLNLKGRQKPSVRQLLGLKSTDLTLSAVEVKPDLLGPC